MKLVPIEAASLLVARTYHLTRLFRLLRFGVAHPIAAERSCRRVVCRPTVGNRPTPFAPLDSPPSENPSFPDAIRIWPSDLPMERGVQTEGMESPLRPRLESFVGAGLDLWS